MLRADDETAEQRGRDVVRVALDLGRLDEDVLRLLGQLVEVVGGEQPCDDGRRARSEPGGQRDLAADPEGDPVSGPQRLESAHAEVRAVERDAEAPASTENEPDSSTSSSRCIASAAASTS